MKLIGLTGGIGSGKSTVAGLFRTLGIPVYESDVQAKSLMNEDNEVREQILHLFGNEAYTDDQHLNRSWLASKAFADPGLLKQLNAIVHPAVYKDLQRWAKEDAQLYAPYLLQESAILFEENLISRLQAVILVVASEEIRINRVMKRDELTEKQIRDRMKFQWPDEKKIPLSDFIIYNDGERPLISQVMDIDKMIRDMRPTA
jgi:dephospho-CoA kinase